MELQSIILAITFALDATSPSKLPPGVNQGPTENHRPVIVRMAGRDKTLTITAGKSGMAYSVADAKGRPLLNGGTLEELRQKYPDLYRQVSTGLADSNAAPQGVMIDASARFEAGY